MLNRKYKHNTDKPIYFQFGKLKKLKYGPFVLVIGIAIEAMFLYVTLCPSIKLDSLSCSFTIGKCKC